MRKGLVIGGSTLGAVLVGVASLDLTRTYCFSEGCEAAVALEEKQRAEQKTAREAEDARIVQAKAATAIGERINVSLLSLSDLRRETMEKIRDAARSSRSDLRSEEQTAQIRLARMESIFAGSGGSGFLAREEGKEQIRALQIAAIEEEQKLVAADSDVFYGVPDPIACDWSSLKCSKGVGDALAAWEENIEQSAEIARSTGLQGSSEIRSLVAAYGTAMAELKTLQAEMDAS